MQTSNVLHFLLTVLQRWAFSFSVFVNTDDKHDLFLERLFLVNVRFTPGEREVDVQVNLALPGILRTLFKLYKVRELVMSP